MFIKAMEGNRITAIASWLESEGIPAMLSNEIMSGYMGTQGVDILVKEEDFEAAKKILGQQG